MLELRTSLSWLCGAAALALSMAYGCSGADSAPPGGVAAASGTGGLDGSSGGTAGAAGSTGGAGGFGAVGGTGGGSQGCTDPTDTTDTDGDDIADQIEGKGDTGGPRDTDGDGTPDYKDDDSDNDGVLDKDEAATPKFPRSGPCDPVADTDGDGKADYVDTDSDNDGLPDKDDSKLCTNNDCRIVADCDGDGVVDVVEVAAQTNACSPDNLDGGTTDFGLYFVVPYLEGPKTKDFTFSTGVKDADIYFMIDTTQSMQPTIDNIKGSLDSQIIPTILNGDPSANPPIPAIPGAYIGIGTFKDVPWAPWGDTGDDIYGFKFDIGGSTVYGNVSPPVSSGGVFTAPANVKTILGSLTASGGGDSPEGTTQALWLASGNKDYRAVGGGEPWPPNPPTGTYDAAQWRAKCSDPNQLGRACFRPGKLPVFVIVTDAPFHNGQQAGACPAGNDYVPGGATIDPSCPAGTAVNGTKSYAETVASLTSIGAKTVGVSVNTGTANLARFDLKDLATQTNSIYAKVGFGGAVTDLPLVTEQDTSTGNVSSEAVRLIGLLAGQGLNDVTTDTKNYSCAGNIDCTGDGIPDPKYDNPPDPNLGTPFDASKLIVSVKPKPVTTNPKPYTKIDNTTFYGVSGDQTVTFTVTADNKILQTSSVVVVEAILHVQTPGGQALGGPEGIKKIYLVIPPYVPPFK